MPWDIRRQIEKTSSPPARRSSVVTLHGHAASHRTARDCISRCTIDEKCSRASACLRNRSTEMCCRRLAPLIRGAAALVVLDIVRTRSHATFHGIVFGKRVLCLVMFSANCRRHHRA